MLEGRSAIARRSASRPYCNCDFQAGGSYQRLSAHNWVSPILGQILHVAHELVPPTARLTWWGDVSSFLVARCRAFRAESLVSGCPTVAHLVSPGHRQNLPSAKCRRLWSFKPIRQRCGACVLAR
jgi:hypothetical protein